MGIFQPRVLVKKVLIKKVFKGPSENRSDNAQRQINVKGEGRECLMGLGSSAETHEVVHRKGENSGPTHFSF